MSSWKFVKFVDHLFSCTRMRLDDLANICRQRLLNVVVVVEENVLSRLELIIVYEEMAGGPLL